jgi:hypothetical protein
MREDQEPVLEALRSPEAYPHRTDDIRLVETHISWVFLTGHGAYKLKKAVALPYVDFSTLEHRERACRDELALNRRLAPALYEAVVGIGGETGALRIGGTPTVEYAVKMRQFPDGATADELIRSDALEAGELAQLAETIAQFHDGLAPSRTGSQAERIRTNLDELESALTDDTTSRIGEIRAWMREAVHGLGGVFAQREAGGRIRECHGDLHLGNIVRVDGRLVAFDCLEFSLELRTIDVIDEVSFLAMDLAAHRRPDLANCFLNRYLEVSGDYAGLRLLRVYRTHRALVRAKVALAAPDDHGPTRTSRAAMYLAAAADETRKSQPLCVITTGLSGSGKTTVARLLAPCLSAVHVRSDVERKRLHGLEARARSGSAIGRDLYGPEATRATYGRLADAAEAALSGNIDVIVDAAFLARKERDRFRALAGRAGARFAILECTAPVTVLRERIVARHRSGIDASEADLAVLEHQLETADGPGDAERDYLYSLDTESGIRGDELARSIRRRSAPPAASAG